MVESIILNMLESSKWRFLNHPSKLNPWYITSLGTNLLLYLLLLSSTIEYNTILSFMSTFPVAIYIYPLKQNRDIFKQNKKSGIYRWTNKLSGKTYVGSAIDLTRRFRSYFSLVFCFFLVIYYKLLEKKKINYYKSSRVFKSNHFFS
jgi:hypothetical protein